MSRETADPAEAARWLAERAVLVRQDGEYHVVAQNLGRRGFRVRLFRRKGKPLVFPARETAEAAVAAMRLGDS